jgi:hypothetical protein
MKTTHPMTKSHLALARTALAIAKIALFPSSSQFSRHDYTQHQLFALREFLKTDYRGRGRSSATGPSCDRPWA